AGFSAGSNTVFFRGVNPYLIEYWLFNYVSGLRLGRYSNRKQILIGFPAIMRNSLFQITYNAKRWGRSVLNLNYVQIRRSDMLRRILSRVTFTGVTRVFQAGNGCISSKKGMGFQR